MHCAECSNVIFYRKPCDLKIRVGRGGGIKSHISIKLDAINLSVDLYSRMNGNSSERVPCLLRDGLSACIKYCIIFDNESFMT